MVVTVADVAVPFLSFLCSSVAAFFLASQTFDNFTPLVSVLCQIFQAIRGVFEVLYLASLGALAQKQFAVE